MKPALGSAQEAATLGRPNIEPPCPECGRTTLAVEELTVMILEARREPGIWRAEAQAKFLAEKINGAINRGRA